MDLPGSSPEAPGSGFYELVTICGHNVVTVRLSARCWISEPVLLQILPVDLPGSSPEAPEVNFMNLLLFVVEPRIAK